MRDENMQDGLDVMKIHKSNHYGDSVDFSIYTPFEKLRSVELEEMRGFFARWIKEIDELTLRNVK